MIRPVVAFAICLLPWTLTAQAQYEDQPLPLGDLARSLRKKKEPTQAPASNSTQASATAAPSKTIIDNDNLTQVMEEAESRHLANTSMLYSFEGAAKMFQISSPDVTCSLSFNGRMSSLLVRPVVPIDMPDEETRKLEGPAIINEEGLQVSVFNGTRWKVEEITVGVTLVRHANSVAARGGLAKLVPAASETTIVAEKPADVTTLYHLKAESLPSSITVFKAPLSSALGPDEEWHWAIVQARGIPPRPEDSALNQPLAPTNNAVIP
ncbi:MAG TPA: hypothetical protein VLL05_09510 [Terriglobales bacterium]|nr:hypothetical protein [Terriglobales bacterium]